MELTPGITIGPYKILGALGVGGMGEVYRAQDTRLGREVAVKVLPDHLAQDPARRSRFDREARLLAALNHPNIATLHGVEAYGERTLIDLELVPGETLGESIARAPLAPDVAMRIFKQIAFALEAAHGAGIIHRDLKPSNVKITPDGRVKVLDFGLAKALEDEPSGEHTPSQAQSFTKTQPGTIFGTIAYMSPEQVRTQRVDRRTDIWSFGCLLYECLTGRQTFGGQGFSATVARVLEREPEWTLLPPIPTGLRRLLLRCLTKDVPSRLRDIADARLEIEDILGESASRAVHVAEARTARPRPRFLVPAIIAATAVTAAGIGWWVGRGSTVPPSAVRLELSLPQGTDLAQGASPPLAISPDGSLLAYVAVKSGGRTQLHLRALDRFEARPLAGTEGASAPFFSPDGRWVGFFTNGALYKVSVDGGATLKIADTPSLWSATWGAGDVIVFATTGSPNRLSRVPAGGGTPEVLTTPDAAQGETQHAFPQMLPEGGRVLFSAVSQKGWFLEIASVDQGARRRLRQSPTNGATMYLPSGHLAYAEAGGLVAVPFDASRGELTGSPIPVLERVEATAFGGALFTVSRSGTLVYVPAVTALPRRTLVAVDREGRTRTLVEDRASFAHPRYSPDGASLAVTIDAGSGRDIWVFDLRRGTRTRLTAGGANAFPVWAPDGDRIAFQATDAAGPSLFTRSRGGGAPTPLVTRSSADANAGLSQDVAGLLPGTLPELAGANPHVPMSWARAGHLAFDERKPSAERDIWIVPRDGAPTPFLLTPFDESSPALSPDGAWIAYVSDESGRSDVYVQPYPGPGGKWAISEAGGTDPLWSPDGNELFYRHGDRLMVVDVQLRSGFRAGTVRPLFEWPQDASDGARSFDVAPDGRSFVMVRTDDGPGPAQLRVVLNWLQDLTARKAAAR